MTHFGNPARAFILEPASLVINTQLPWDYSYSTTSQTTTRVPAGISPREFLSSSIDLGFFCVCFVLFFKLLLLSLLCIFPSLALGRRVTHFVMSITLVSVLVASALLNDYQLWFLSAARPVFLSDVALNHVQLHAYMLHTYSCILCEHLNIYIACTNINVLVWRRTKRVYKI